MLTLEPPGVSYSASPDPGVSVYVLCKLVVFFKSYDDFEGNQMEIIYLDNMLTWPLKHQELKVNNHSKVRCLKSHF